MSKENPGSTTRLALRGARVAGGPPVVAPRPAAFVCPTTGSPPSSVRVRSRTGGVTTQRAAAPLTRGTVHTAPSAIATTTAKATARRAALRHATLGTLSLIGT